MTQEAKVSEDKRSELYFKEQAVLRTELVSLKNCQITFLTYAITGSGVLLGLAYNMASTENAPFPNLGVLYLIPLTIILPFWWIFFDKATTITRIVGYYRILEELLIDPTKEVNYVGWENSLTKFRGQYGVMPQRSKGSFKLALTNFLNLLLLQTSHRYWMLTFYTFASLSLVALLTCFFTLKVTISETELFVSGAIFLVGFSLGYLKGWRVQVGVVVCSLGLIFLIFYFTSYPPSRMAVFVLFAAAFIVGVSITRNFTMVQRLAWGEYSYNFSYDIWKTLLIPQTQTSQNASPSPSLPLPAWTQP